MDPKNEQEIINLAAAEGHDADVPSNIGRIPTTTTARQLHDVGISSPATAVSTTSDFEKDIEKEAGSRRASTTSHASTHEKKQNDTTPAAPPEEDPNIVGWDGPNDPQNPMNWSKGRKWGAIMVVSGITFLTPLGSSIFAPGVELVMHEFHSTNVLLEGFIVSVYVLGFAFGPLVIAPLSEMYGRLPLYHSCNFFFIILNIACAVCTDINQLIVFRFFAGCFGAAPLTLGGGTIADLIPPEQRATAMAIWILGPTVGPVIGPIAGGFISEALGWRWNFWIMTIAAGVTFLLGLVLIRETYAPIILGRKAARLRKETGNPDLRSKFDSGLTPRDLFLLSIVRPTKMLLFSPIVFLLSLYVAIVYAYLYLLFTTVTFVFESQYGFRSDLVGLAYIGIGLGAFVSQFAYTWYANRSYRIHKAKGDSKPEHRLESMVVGCFLIPISLFWYGWSVQANVQWMCPIIATAVFGVGLLLIFMPANTYLVDVFTIHAASAMAANTVFRSIAAALLPLAGPSLYAKLGYGWGNSLLGFVAVLMIPVPFIFLRYGEYIRTKPSFQVKL